MTDYPTAIAHAAELQHLSGDLLTRLLRHQRAGAPATPIVTEILLRSVAAEVTAIEAALTAPAAPVAAPAALGPTAEKPADHWYGAI